METSVKKWGNSLGIRIPKNLADQIELQVGTKIELSIDNKILSIKKSQKKETLDSLLLKVNSENKHKEIETYPVGKEL